MRRFDLRCEDLSAASGVVANLTGPLLIALAARLPTAARDLIVAGLLQEESDRVLAAFAERGLRLRERRDAGEWTALLLG